MCMCVHVRARERVHGRVFLCTCVHFMKITAGKSYWYDGARTPAIYTPASVRCRMAQRLRQRGVVLTEHQQ